jgi:hypothetical protein
MRKKPVKAERIELWKDVSALFEQQLAREREDLERWEENKRLRSLWGLRTSPAWFDRAITRSHQGEVRLLARAMKKLGKVLRCGAKTRKGTPCQCKPMPGKRRCRNHGGLSQGPKTEGGKAAIMESNRRRAEARRNSQAETKQTP